MKIKFAKKDTQFSAGALLAGIHFMLFTLSACKTIDIKDKADLLPHILKPVAFMTV